MKLSKLFLVALAVVLVPAAALAQTQIVGQVTDNTGGSLPDVTVEARGAALIERARTANTDDQGRSTIVDLRPGAYTITFTLSGFNVLVRDGIRLPSDFTATIDAEMTVGALEKSVTVSGETPVVDIQQEGGEFDISGLRVDVKAEVFNLRNADFYLSTRSPFVNTPVYDVPVSIVPARLLRLASTIRW